jgi:hypothetical protein
VLEQPPAQAVEAHEFGAHVTVWAAGQAPLPLQPAANVAVPPVQLAARQEVLAPG